MNTDIIKKWFFRLFGLFLIFGNLFLLLNMDSVQRISDIIEYPIGVLLLPMVFTFFVGIYFLLKELEKLGVKNERNN